MIRKVDCLVVRGDSCVKKDNFPLFVNVIYMAQKSSLPR